MSPPHGHLRTGTSVSPPHGHLRVTSAIRGSNRRSMLTDRVWELKILTNEISSRVFFVSLSFALQAARRLFWSRHGENTTPSSNGYNLLTPSSNGYNLLTPSSNGYNLLTPSSNGYNLLTPSSNGYNLLTKRFEDICLVPTLTRSLESLRNVKNTITITLTVA